MKAPMSSWEAQATIVFSGQTHTAKISASGERSRPSSPGCSGGSLVPLLTTLPETPSQREEARPRLPKRSRAVPQTAVTLLARLRLRNYYAQTPAADSAKGPWSGTLRRVQSALRSQ